MFLPHPHSPSHHDDGQILSRGEGEVARIDNGAVGSAQEVEEETHDAVPDQEDDDVRTRLCSTLS